MAYSYYRVVRLCPRTRALLGVVAEGLTMGAANDLARALAPGDDSHRYDVQTMPLAQQVRLLAAVEPVAALAA